MLYIQAEHGELALRWLPEHENTLVPPRSFDRVNNTVRLEPLLVILDPHRDEGPRRVAIGPLVQDPVGPRFELGLQMRRAIQGRFLGLVRPVRVPLVRARDYKETVPLPLLFDSLVPGALQGQLGQC